MRKFITASLCVAVLATFGTASADPQDDVTTTAASMARASGDGYLVVSAQDESNPLAFSLSVMRIADDSKALIEADSSNPGNPVLTITVYTLDSPNGVNYRSVGSGERLASAGYVTAGDQTEVVFTLPDELSDQGAMLTVSTGIVDYECPEHPGIEHSCWGASGWHNPLKEVLSVDALDSIGVPVML